MQLIEAPKRNFERMDKPNDENYRRIVCEFTDRFHKWGEWPCYVLYEGDEQIKVVQVMSRPWRRDQGNANVPGLKIYFLGLGYRHAHKHGSMVGSYLFNFIDLQLFFKYIRWKIHY